LACKIICQINLVKLILLWQPSYDSSFLQNYDFWHPFKMLSSLISLFGLWVVCKCFLILDFSWNFVWSTCTQKFFLVLLNYFHLKMQILREGQEEADSFRGTQCSYCCIKEISGMSWIQFQDNVILPALYAACMQSFA